MNKLTDRELEILKCIINGMSNSDIAKEKFITIHTAKAHVKSILHKLGVTTRLGIAVVAITQGLVKIEDIHIKQNFVDYV